LIKIDENYFILIFNGINIKCRIKVLIDTSKSWIFYDKKELVAIRDINQAKTDKIQVIKVYYLTDLGITNAEIFDFATGAPALDFQFCKSHFYTKLDEVILL